MRGEEGGSIKLTVQGHGRDGPCSKGPRDAPRNASEAAAPPAARSRPASPRWCSRRPPGARNTPPGRRRATCPAGPAGRRAGSARHGFARAARRRSRRRSKAGRCRVPPAGAAGWSRCCGRADGSIFSRPWREKAPGFRRDLLGRMHYHCAVLRPGGPAKRAGAGPAAAVRPPKPAADPLGGTFDSGLGSQGVRTERTDSAIGAGTPGGRTHHPPARACALRAVLACPPERGSPARVIVMTSAGRSAVPTFYGRPVAAMAEIVAEGNSLGILSSAGDRGERNRCEWKDAASLRCYDRRGGKASLPSLGRASCTYGPPGRPPFGRQMSSRDSAEGNAVSPTGC